MGIFSANGTCFLALSYVVYEYPQQEKADKLLLSKLINCHAESWWNETEILTTRYSVIDWTPKSQKKNHE